MEHKSWGEGKEMKKFVVTKLVEAMSIKEAVQVAQADGTIVAIYELQNTESDD